MAEGDGGNGNEGGVWKDLPEDIRNHPSMTSLDGVESLAKSWVNAQKLIGKEKLPIPSGPEDVETWNSVFARLGRPENAEGYSEIKPEDIPKEIPIDENFLKGFKETAFKLGLLPNQVKGLFDWWVTSEKGVMENAGTQEQEAKEAAETALRQEWGRAYDQNVKLAVSVIRKFGGSDAEALLKSSIGNDSLSIKMLAAAGKALSEDNLLGEPPGMTMTPAEAQAEISKIQNSPEHPYYKDQHPEHKSAVEHMQNLFKLVYPEGTA